MAEKLHLESLSKRIMAVLHKHNLTPGIFTLSITLLGNEFDALALKYPSSHGAIFLESTEGDSIQWSIQILRGGTSARAGPF
jgi:hypothetical protein